MSTRLDEAIDQVAKRLTHVDDDAQFTSRVVAALPGRLTWFGWLTHSWAPRLAMMAIVAGSLLFWSARRTTEVPPSASPLASVSNTNWPQLVAVAVRRPVALLGTAPQQHGAALEDVEPFHGIPSVEAPVSVDIAALDTSALPTTDSLVVAPLVVADLPLTADFPERH